MNEEKNEIKKESNESKFGKVIDALHSKQKLSSLRTYQGDVAEFMKEKNQSTVSVAVKEKERKEEREKLEPVVKKEKKESQPINLTMLALSLILILGGVVASLYIFESLKEGPPEQVVVEEKIIPYSNEVTLANVTKDTLDTELIALPVQNGINVVKISDTRGRSFSNVSDFFGFLNISLSGALQRTLEDKYAVGIISQDGVTSYFLVITVSDFGNAFSAMLDWEEDMDKDLAFLIPEDDLGTASAPEDHLQTASSTATTTPAETFIPPLVQKNYSWKDVIIKNKDTRALIDQQGKSKIAYTFLDKNTILIINDTTAIGEMSSAYASRSFTR